MESNRTKGDEMAHADGDNPNPIVKREKFQTATIRTYADGTADATTGGGGLSPLFRDKYAHTRFAYSAADQARDYVSQNGGIQG